MRMFDIHIHEANEPMLLKLRKKIYGMFGKRHGQIAINGVIELSSEYIQGVNIRNIEDR